MWYAILIVLLIIAVFKWQIYKLSLRAYVGFMKNNEVKQPTESEVREWIHWAAKNMFNRK